MSRPKTRSSDDGPTPGYTEEVLSILRSYDASATFYLTGHESAENISLLREIIDAGNELGNHTYTHRKLYFISNAQESPRKSSVPTPSSAPPDTADP